jgi:hypothetical protein
MNKVLQIIRMFLWFANFWRDQNFIVDNGTAVLVIFSHRRKYLPQSPLTKKKKKVSERICKIPKFTDERIVSNCQERQYVITCSPKATEVLEKMGREVLENSSSCSNLDLNDI